MGITLELKVESPLTDDDRDLLAGLSVMLVAVANRQNVEEQEPEEEPQEPAADTTGMN